MNHSERLVYWQGAAHLYESIVIRLSNPPPTGLAFLDHERDAHARETCMEGKAWLCELAAWVDRADPSEPPPHPRIRRVFQV